MESLLPAAGFAYFVAANGAAALIGGICLGALPELLIKKEWSTAVWGLALGVAATGFATAVFWLPTLTAMSVWPWRAVLVISILAWLVPMLWLWVVAPINERRQYGLRTARRKTWTQ